MLGDIQGIADQRASTSMLYSSSNDRVTLDDIDSEASAFDEVAVLFLNRLDLDGVQGNECRLASTLITHILMVSHRDSRQTYFDALDSRFLVVDDDGVNVATQDCHDCRLVLASSRLDQVDNTTVHTSESATVSL